MACIKTSHFLKKQPLFYTLIAPFFMYKYTEQVNENNLQLIIIIISIHRELNYRHLVRTSL